MTQTPAPTTRPALDDPSTESNALSGTWLDDPESLRSLTGDGTPDAPSAPAEAPSGDTDPRANLTAPPLDPPAATPRSTDMTERSSTPASAEAAPKTNSRFTPAPKPNTGVEFWSDIVSVVPERNRLQLVRHFPAAIADRTIAAVTLDNEIEFQYLDEKGEPATHRMRDEALIVTEKVAAWITRMVNEAPYEIMKHTGGLKITRDDLLSGTLDFERMAKLRVAPNMTRKSPEPTTKGTDRAKANDRPRKATTKSKPGTDS